MPSLTKLFDPMIRDAKTTAGQDFSLLVMRTVSGGFLIWEVLDNLLSKARMHEFAQFLANHHYPWPEFMAPLSVWFQFLAGLAWLLGFHTRPVAALVAMHFLLAWFTVHADQPLRAGWPALALVAMALVLATHGAGRWSLDVWRMRWKSQRAISK